MLYEWWERYRRLLIITGIFLLITISFLLYPGSTAEQAPSLPLETPAYASEGDSKRNGQSTEKTDPAAEKTARSAERDGQAEQSDEQRVRPKLIYVDLKGSVKHPGLYTFSDQERIADAIAKAGGALPNADTNQINLAQLLTDGSVVRIPAKGESIKAASPCSLEASGLSTSGAGIEPSTGHANLSHASPGLAEGKVNINTASLQQLMTLPGIGETRAKAILAYREKNGSFRSPDQLKKVGGIGERTYEQLKNKITL